MNVWVYVRVGGPFVMMGAAWHHWIIVALLAAFFWVLACLPYEDDEVELELVEDDDG